MNTNKNQDRSAICVDSRRGSNAETAPGAMLVAGTGLVVTSVTIDDPETISEACRWSTGERGDPVDISEAALANLEPFVRCSVELGARVLASTADTSGVVALSGTVIQLADRAEAATASLVEGATKATGQVVEATVNATRQATEATAKIISAASEEVEEEMARTVKAGIESVTKELDRLIGSESAPVAQAVKEIVGKAMAEAQVTWQRTLTSTLTQVTTTLDASNPASPLGALERRLNVQHDRLHSEITTKLDKVQEVIGATVQAAETAAAVAAVQSGSPAKGYPFEDAVADALETIASGLGAAYTRTADSVGCIRGCKKGDGVLELAAAATGMPPARVTVECTTGTAKRNWSGYLDEAERNREAQASLGVVPQPSQVPGGEMLAVLTPNRIILAFDPSSGDTALLRAAVQLLAIQAQRRLAEAQEGDLSAVDTAISDARRMLVTMQDLLKTATSVKTGAAKVVTGMESLQAGLGLLLDQAQAGLRHATHSSAA